MQKTVGVDTTPPLGSLRVKRRIRRMIELTKVFWESVSKSWCSVGKGTLAELEIG